MAKKTVAIVGAGIVGITTAYLLKRAGYHVILLEAEQGPALKTSFANGCQLSYSYIDAMSSPNLIKKIPKILAGMDPAFRLQLSPDLSFINWGCQFLNNAQVHKEQSNTQTLLRLALHSRDVLHALLAESDVEFQHRHSGKLLIYSNQQDLNNAAIRVEQKAIWGCQQQILDAKQCLALEPCLQQLSHPIVGGVYSSIDDVGDPYLFANELLKSMESDSDFDIRFHCRVNRLVNKGCFIQHLDTSDGDIHADAFVVATGSESLNLAKELGVSLPIYPIKGYSITVPATEFAPRVCITDVDNKVVLSRVGENLRIAGCADIVGHQTDIDHRRIDHLLDVCRRNFPKAGNYDQLLHTWAGLRPVTPSSVPIIGNAGAENLFFNIGHGMLGWTLAMGSASALTSVIQQHPPPIDMAGLKPVDHGIH